MRSRITNIFGMYFALAVTLIIGFIIYCMPIDVPEGFPFAAKTLSSEQIVQNSHINQVLFTDKTLEARLNFFHQQGDEHLAGIDESLGSGACSADFNSDGWVDLFLVNGSGQTRYYGKQYWWQTSQSNTLFINDGGQGFRDATPASGLDQNMWGMGCLASDFDNDGDIDLLITGKDGNLFYKNNGDSTFTNVSQESGIIGGYWSTSASAIDFNSDGLLDIYIGNFIDFEKGKKTFEASSQFTGEKKHSFDASLYQAQPNRLYQNLGGLKFQDITAESGVMDSEGRTLDVSWQDINQDGLPDLIASNDRGTGSNASFLNKDGEHFEPGGQALGLRSSLGSRGTASGDLDNDGDIDLVIASSAGESTIALINEKSSDGKFRYKDRAREIGIGADQFLSISAWSPLVQDFNNDGFNDVFIAAGQLEPDPDSAKISQGQPKQLLLNNGKGYFVDSTMLSGVALRDRQSARGAVAADFDNDGDIDVYVTHNNDLGQYLVNESPKQQWLGLKLIGTKSNRDAVGAKVQLDTANGNQTKFVVSGEGFLSDSDKRIVFGLGQDSKIDQLIIDWPSGDKQTIHAIQANHYWQITESSDDALELPGTTIVEKPVKHLRLKLGVDQASIRVGYLKMLSQAKDTKNIWSELSVAANDSDSSVRREAIDFSSRTNSVQGLSILVHGLEDAEPANVIAAITGLRNYEDETSVRWLLRVFSHQDAAVKIELADCFAHFFQEEEAVVYRKYLAVPYLIRLLDDPDPNVRIAAVRALGQAERFRGVHALLDHLSDSEASVRAEIVRTLGLIRQAKALPNLTELLSDRTQSTHVVANTFIALKRLGDDGALKKLESFLMGEGGFESVELEKRLAVFADLLAQDDEATVFDAQELKRVTHVVFQKFPPVVKSTGLAPHWIAIWRHISDQAGISWLDKQTSAAQLDVRADAYRALFYERQGHTERSSILRRAWSDQELGIKALALKELLREKMALTQQDYRTILTNPELQTVGLQFWSENGLTAADSNLLIKAIQSVYLPEFAVNNSDALLEKICFSTNANLQKICSVVLFSSTIAEHREIAVKILRDPAQPIAIRQSVLNHYGVNFDSDAINVLYGLLQTKKDPLHNDVVTKLLSFDSDALIEFARKIAMNASEDAETRLQAIGFLVRLGRSDAQEILYR
ncbi:FG-GAP-like repeat-containing protein [Methylomonas albis]|uniref:VCBS repeat-containing protein n=1 Tax=Methylomonas albis TaxID=1854563 RepID=A0ABR9D6W2_9GAMM|nr:FG-GAP-like repeat-containing protein [Methylomonas albis]MBD9358862.1 VCBS repeat-containing protein [Methylomonas albis]